MRSVTDAAPITIDGLRALAPARFGDMVKAVVDLERRLMLVDADMHADQESELLASGSRQTDLRPSFGNRSRGIDDPAIRQRVAALVETLVRR